MEPNRDNQRAIIPAKSNPNTAPHELSNEIMLMLKDIVAIKPLDDYQLHLRFEDGVEGVDTDLNQYEIQFRSVGDSAV